MGIYDSVFIWINNRQEQNLENYVNFFGIF